MANEESNLHLARIKLAELRRQRDRLTAHYAGTAARAVAAATPEEKLRVLEEGLRETRFARRPLHPDAGNLDLLLLEAELGVASPEQVRDWTRRLEQELGYGRRRAEYAHLFGRLLEDWVSPPTPEGADPVAASDEPERERPDWSFLWSNAETPIDLDFLRGLLSRHPKVLEEVRKDVQAFGDGESRAPVSTDEVKALLGMLAGSVYRQPQLRQQAIAIRSSDVQVAEYAGALTILLHHLEEWDWPEEGLTLRTLWVRNKWRPYLDEDLLTLLFLQLLGLRWGMRLKSQFQQHINGYRGVFSPTRVMGEDDWDGPLPTLQRSRAGQFFLPMIPWSLLELTSSGGYGGGYGKSSRSLETPTLHEQLLAHVQAEIRTLQALHPDQPVYVVQTDLRDYYLRIPHAVALLLIEQLGFPPVWQEFFRRYLAVRVRHEGAVHPLTQGVLLDHLLGAVLADFLLLLLDIHIHASADLRAARLIDDLYCVAVSPEQAVSAWEAIRRFCTAAGLEPNERKSGAVCLGTPEELPTALPESLPRWGLLRLHPSGEWLPDDEAIETMRAWMRRQAEKEPSVLGMIARYNAHLYFVWRFLGLPVRLDADHLQRVGQRLAQLHQGLFGPGHGMVAEVRRRMRDRFPDLAREVEALPEALLYWPITAGGLGLAQPLTPVAGFRKGLASSPTPSLAMLEAEEEIPFGPPNSTPFYYSGLARPLPLEGPERTPAMAGLLQDFIARGGEVSGREQAGLSPTWEWVIYTYGPGVLETFGSFRFLLTELVPLQLILLNQMQASTFEEDPGPEIVS